MSPKTTKEERRNWLSTKHHNIRTACMARNYDIAFKVAYEILRINPNDDYALYVYGSCLCIKGDFEEAITVFKHLWQTRPITKSKYVLISLFQAELNLKNFEQAYEYILYLKDFFPDVDLGLYETFLRYKLYDDISLVPFSWYAYDASYVLNHIINRHSVSGNDTSYFNEEVNLEDLFYDISKRLEEIPRNETFNPFLPLHSVGVNDVYFFKMPNCGYCCNGKSCNFLKVVTVPFSKDIISLFPVSHVGGDVEIHEIKKEKVMIKGHKSIGQIEKFNRKWQRKNAEI